MVGRKKAAVDEPTPENPVTYNIKAWDMEGSPDSATFIVIGNPGSGKTSFVKNYLYYRRHKYPVATLCSGTSDESGDFEGIIPPLFTSSKWNEDREKKYIERQKKAKKSPLCKNPLSVHIVDDCSDDVSIYRKPVVNAFFKLGSRHWANAVFFLGHGAIELQPNSRKCGSYFVIFYEPSPIEREKIWKNFGGILGNYNQFCEIMDQICGTPYRCMIIDNRTMKKNVEDKLFYYDVKPCPKFKFGCKQYRKHSKQRYNTNYEPPVV
ncbi:putative A32-like packaging ATPase [Golden Marseillevirus]|uniref:putative A32-like packaging ATPase n=1 Tax=Golden Marseillevirus TaxID=1720526 RepID=UPI000877AA81|nr:putative A32-like packaging ATPase [Golden Marseillevirus]ALX27468.1 putative A32-like packaging ATPase [Golden Marseillevirus]